MSWLRVDDALRDHPKARRAGLEALGLWLLAGCWASAHATDGHLPAEVIRAIPGYRAVLADRLVTARLWEAVSDGWQMHDFLNYNPSAAERQAVRDGAAERQRKWRATRDERVSHSVSHTAPLPSPSVPLDQSTDPLRPPLPPKGVKRSAPAVVLPDWMPDATWEGWRAHRKAIRAPMTPHAEALSLRKLEGWRAQGRNPVEVVELAIERGWRGLFLDSQRAANGTTPRRGGGTGPTWKDPAP